MVILWWVAIIMTVCFTMLTTMCIWAVMSLPKNPDDVTITVAIVVVVIMVSLFLPIFWQFVILGDDSGKTCLSTQPNSQYSQQKSICLD